MPIFDQSIFSAAEATHGLDAPEYLAALAESGVALRSDLETLFAGQALHALVLPSNGLAFKTDWVAGDQFSLGSASFAAMSGYPSVSVPAGLARDLPVGVSFVGRPLEDAALLQIAYAFEQATLARREPQYLSTLER
jgi:amidase